MCLLLTYCICGKEYAVKKSQGTFKTPFLHTSADGLKSILSGTFRSGEAIQENNRPRFKDRILHLIHNFQKFLQFVLLPKIAWGLDFYATGLKTTDFMYIPVFDTLILLDRGYFGVS